MCNSLINRETVPNYLPKLCLTSSIFLGCLLPVTATQAQIIPDDTLGDESTIVNSAPNFYNILEGAIRGNNLFHSFLEFNVDAGSLVNFSITPDLANIITRVTGSNPSQISGNILVGGNANLFLLNPNGIIIGDGASLNIGGSFIASTADSLIFTDGTEFSAINPEVPPLLTVSIPLGLQYGANPGAITSENANLALLPNNTLALMGGEVSITGSRLRAQDGGRIEIGSVANTVVTLTPVDNGWTFTYPDHANFRDILITQSAEVTTNQVDAINVATGDINIQGDRITISENAQIFINTEGIATGGNITLDASTSLELSGSLTTDIPTVVSTIVEPAATGNGGSITINTPQLLVQNGAQIQAVTLGMGDAGNINVNSETIQLLGISSFDVPSGLFANAESLAIGNGGNITINSPQLLVEDGAQIQTVTRSMGDAGNIKVNSETIQLLGISPTGVPSGLFANTELSATGAGGNIDITTNQLLIRDGAQAGVVTFGEGNSGDLEVVANNIELIGSAPSDLNDTGLSVSGLFAGTQPGSIGTGGDFNINTATLLITDGAEAQASTLGEGDAGNLTVIATESIELSGNTTNGEFPSGLLAVSGLEGVTTAATGVGGDINITTPQLIVRDGATITVGSAGSSTGGELKINATETILLTGNSSLSSQAIGNGNAGNLEIITAEFTIESDSEVTVSSNSGSAGDLVINAENLFLDAGKLRAETAEENGAAEEGANIDLAITNLVRMSNESLISANAREEANGGNVTINSQFIIAEPPQGNQGSDIVANAVAGRGGEVRINTQGLFGIEFKPSNTQFNDITASSEFGDAGIVEIVEPNVDPAQSITNLPTDLVEATNLIVRSCAIGGESELGRFVVTGRGGLPPQPEEFINSEDLTSEWISVDNSAVEMENRETGFKAKQSPIIEAQGWYVNARGNVVLTAQTQSLHRQTVNLVTYNCNNHNNKK